jgi:hypothetical protein
MPRAFWGFQLLTPMTVAKPELFARVPDNDLGHSGSNLFKIQRFLSNSVSDQYLHWRADTAKKKNFFSQFREGGVDHQF